MTAPFTRLHPGFLSRVLALAAALLTVTPAVGGQTAMAPDVTRLSESIDRALAENPSISSMKRAYDRASAKIPSAGALPDPVLTYSYMGNAIPVPPFDLQRRDPSSLRQFTFTQDVPYPGKRALRTRIAAADAESEWWALLQARIDLTAEVKDAYFEWWFATKALGVTTKVRDLLERFAKIAEAKYAVGKGVQQDVLKARVEIAKLQGRIDQLEQRRRAAEARLNSLQYRDTDAPLGEPEELDLRDFGYTVEELKRMAVSDSPWLKAQRRKIDRETFGVELARKDFYPDFTLGATYALRAGQTNMFGLSVGIRLPIYSRRKQLPALNEAAAAAAGERRQLESRINLMFFRIKDRYLAAVTAIRLARLYATTVIPQSALTIESAVAGYEVGKVDFLTLLDGLSTLLDYEIGYYEQLGAAERAVAAIEPLVARPLR
jgi:outer membrane protein, heavy metal efflux system